MTELSGAAPIGVSEKAIRWTLFCLMAATLPVLYFMFVIAGFLPLIEIARMMREGVWGFKLFNAIHLLVYGTIFYFLAGFIARRLARLSAGRRWAGFGLITAAMVAVSFLPIYGVGHSAYAGVSVYRLFFPPPPFVPEAMTPSLPPQPMLAPQVVPQQRKGPLPAQAPR
jgi:hypothetical protein